MAVKTFTMLAKNYEDQMVLGWLASEKLDGCRALWLPNFPPEYSNDPDIEPTGLWSRDGKVIHAPKWWLQHLPKIPVDGELWLDRKSFQRTMSIVRKDQPIVKEWQYIKFMAFDAPVKMNAGLIKFRNNEIMIPDIQLHPDRDEPFLFKFAHAYLKNKTEQNDIYKVVDQIKIRSVAQIQELLDEVVANGGEGLMLRDPFSTWEQSRSGKILKVKPFYYMDVKVTGYYYGDGKYYGMMGALEVQNEAGKTFKVSGFTDEERRVGSLGLPFTRNKFDDCQFPIGSTITIKYRELSDGGTPKEARYHRCN